MKNQVLTTLVLLLLTMQGALAATTAPFDGTVKGKVIDAGTNQALEYATVTLHHAKDSSMVTGLTTASDGTFNFDKIPKGTYFLKYTFIGYDNQYSKPFTITSAVNKMDAGILALSSGSKEINEVQVTGQKSLFVNAIDRKVYNIEKDMMSMSGVVSDLLQNIPSVSVDIEGNIGLRGSDNVMILINGKPTNFTAASRASLLQTMQANSVERIEVITNPSARYKPDGTSGIINIVLKKNTTTGFNGAVIVNAGNQNRYNTSISANYKTQKLNLNGSYGYRVDNRDRTNEDTRRFLRYDPISGLSHLINSTSVYSHETTKPISQNGQIGLDYDFDDHNQMSVSLSYNYRTQDRNAPTSYLTTDSTGSTIKKYSRVRTGTEPESELSNVFQFTHKFAKEGHEISVNNEFQQGTEDEVFNYVNTSEVPAIANSFENTSLKQKVQQNDLEVNYTNPFNEDITLEAGYNMVYESRNMPFIDEYRNAQTGPFINDATKSNHFNYDQYVHAVYTTYAQEVSRFSYMLGLRAEKAYINSRLVTLDSVVPNNYFSLFPTAHFKYELNKNNELQLNYSRRVRRPESDDLNPFPEYRELNSIRSGNPKLKPEYTHSIEAAFLSKGEVASFQSTLYYRRKTNGFTNYTRPINDSTLLSTYANLKTDQSTGLEMILNTSIKKKINNNLSVNVFYNQFDASNIGYSSNQANVVWMAKLNSTATVTPTTMVQFNASYMAPRLTAQGKMLERYILNLGARQDLFKKRASVMLTVSDLLNSMKESYTVNTSVLSTKGIRRRDARVIYIGFTYRFGQSQKKGKDDVLQFDDKM